MNRTFTVQPEAQAEIEQIYDHLEEAKPGLGDRFVDALEVCFNYIRRSPLGHQIRRKHYRHAMVEGFSYRIVYTVDDDDIFVYQVRHTSRKPTGAFGP
jgi:plasmid stabilization system protein ParE